jgi:succinate dehydrogenase / fumarate reductase, cytochrome b subunit
MTQVAAKPRPLSPHLQIYRPQITSVLSILHRISGVGLCLALPVLVWWLTVLSLGPQDYEAFRAFMMSWFGKLLLMGWSTALLYHLAAGIRHLLWDTGWGFELKQVQLTGYIVLAFTAIGSLILWILIWMGA